MIELECVLKHVNVSVDFAPLPYPQRATDGAPSRDPSIWSKWPPARKKINWNDAEPVKGKLTVLTQHLNLHDFENPNLASSFERLKIFPRNTKRDLEENENFSKMKTIVVS